MRVHVLLFDAGTDSEGIHSLEIEGRTVVLLFEDADDAERYAGLLEAQDFPTPTVEAVERSEMEAFCEQSGYEGRLVPQAFRPSTDEERLMLAPPPSNRDVSDWKEAREADASNPAGAATEDRASSSEALDALRRQLEGLL
ncbi:DUF3110 domain-containing protein [Synechococcus sp. RSCCF101]|uniref:DUF3110 domain-containing protein n=1 Tax=Synechococcus sp. RSCCF101 TaxID=2511069 RepID=UPI001CD9E5BF|nr:DUF3110 domain-containing protein [Synechococcus sp. RSCCF101]